MSTEKERIEGNRAALAKTFEDYIKLHPSEEDPTIFGTIDRHAGTSGTSRWGTLSSALKEILKDYKAEDLFHHEQLDPSLKLDELDRAKKYCRDARGLPTGETQTVFFAFAPGAETPIHNHWAVCVSYDLKGEGKEKLFKRTDKDPSGTVELELIKINKRTEGSIALDLQTGDDFTHQFINTTDGVINTIHFYGTNVSRNPNQYRYKLEESGSVGAGAGTACGTTLTDAAKVSDGYPKEVIARLVGERPSSNTFAARTGSATTTPFARR